MEVFKQSVIALVLIFLLSTLAPAEEKLAGKGTVEGIIERVDSDVGGLFSIWFKVQGRMHEFMVGAARVENGSKSQLAAGKHVRVQFENREHSEMDDFYTANATMIAVLTGP